MTISDSAPIFQSIFKNFEILPRVFKDHYKNRPFCDDVTICAGKMRVWLSPIMQISRPFLSITKTLIAKSGENIDVIVRFLSNPNDNSFTFHRSFNFHDKSIEFISRLVPLGGDMVIEWTGAGIGWGARFTAGDDMVHLTHYGYFVRIFGKPVKLPLEFLMGKATAWERALSENEFEMYMEIRHFFFGKLYEYSGKFRMIQGD